MSRGYELCEDDAGNVWWWKRCEIGGCQDLVCTWKSDRFCWSHSGSSETLPAMLERLRCEPVDAYQRT